MRTADLGIYASFYLKFLHLYFFEEGRRQSILVRLCSLELKFSFHVALGEALFLLSVLLSHDREPGQNMLKAWVTFLKYMSLPSITSSQRQCSSRP